MSNLKDSWNVFPLFRENAKNEAKFLETKTMIMGRDAAEFGSPWNFLITYYHQRDLTLGVLLEIFAIQKWDFFKMLTVTYFFKVICYKN